MKGTYLIFLVAFATCLRGGLTDEDVAPEPKLISTFQIVRFPNDACIGTSSRNGTCYTSAECSDKGGSSSGSCADGFGVCCTFTITTCGQTASQNITYWDMTPTQSTSAQSECTLTVCPMNSDITQLRIDFTTFVITGPSTTLFIDGMHSAGNIIRHGEGVTANSQSNYRGMCLIDTFSVNGASSANNPPTICGTNNLVHMYVDANPECNDLMFHFSAIAGRAPANTVVDNRGLNALATRDWDMTVYQYEDGHINAAPPGCTQYIWDSTQGRITGYNFQGGTQLANQNQKVCIRRERNVCWACFKNDGVANFEIAGENAVDNTFTTPGFPCGYSCESDAAGAMGAGAAGNGCGTYDCVIIPGAFVTAAAGVVDVDGPNTVANIRNNLVAAYNNPAPPQITSNGTFGVGVADLNLLVGLPAAEPGIATAATVCTYHVPFMMQFKSDGYEGTGAAGEHLQSNTGLNLIYETITCT